MENIKKGDFIVSKREAWEIMELNSGIYLCILRMSSDETELKVGSRATFSRSHIRHKISNSNFFVVPKGKASTIKILYS